MYKLLILLSFSFLLFSCEEDNSVSAYEDVNPEIREAVSDEVLEKMEDLGVTINTGTNPPNVEGLYLVSPGKLLSSTVPDDNPINQNRYFSDTYIKLYNQNSQDMTITSDLIEYGMEGSGVGSYIMGEGDMFSVFVEFIYGGEYGKAEVIMSYSGKLTDEGYEDLRLGFFMKKILENPLGAFIPEGTGRVIIDEDGLVEKLPDDYLDEAGGIIATINEGNNRNPFIK